MIPASGPGDFLLESWCFDRVRVVVRREERLLEPVQDLPGTTIGGNGGVVGKDRHQARELPRALKVLFGRKRCCVGLYFFVGRVDEPAPKDLRWIEAGMLGAMFTPEHEDPVKDGPFVGVGACRQLTCHFLERAHHLLGGKNGSLLKEFPQCRGSFHRNVPQVVEPHVACDDTIEALQVRGKDSHACYLIREDTGWARTRRVPESSGQRLLSARPRSGSHPRWTSGRSDSPAHAHSRRHADQD